MDKHGGDTGYDRHVPISFSSGSPLSPAHGPEAVTVSSLTIYLQLSRKSKAETNIHRPRWRSRLSPRKFWTRIPFRESRSRWRPHSAI